MWFKEALNKFIAGLLKAVGKELFHVDVESKVIEVSDEKTGDSGMQQHVVFSVILKADHTSSVKNGINDNKNGVMEIVPHKVRKSILSVNDNKLVLIILVNRQML